MQDSLLNWFLDYFTRIYQHVVSSASVEVTSGVLQGSILGQFLFLTTFNNIFLIAHSDGSFLEVYADDFTYYKLIHSNSDL